MNLEQILEDLFAGAPIMRWTAIAVVILSTVLILALLKRIVLGRIRNVASSRKDLRWLQYVEAMFSRTKVFLYFAVGLYTAMLVLDFGPELSEKLVSFVQVLVILQLGVWATAGSTVIVERMKVVAEDDPDQVTALSAFNFVFDLVIWSIVVLLTLANLGFDITTLIASLGIGGVAVALASQAVLGDLLAFFSIIIDKPFVRDDFVVVGETAGSIEYIGMKTTRIRSIDGEQIIFPNQGLLENRVRNFKRMENRRVVLEFGVTYDTSSEELEAIPGLIQEIVESVHSEEVPLNFDRAHLKDFGESSLRFEVVYAVLSPDYNVHMDVRQAILTAILREFRKRRIDIAFPTRTVHLGQHEPSKNEMPVQEARMEA